MTTKLEGVVTRELVIGSDAYTLSLSDAGFTLALKGKRKGLDVRWADLVSGEAALATALNASLTANIRPPPVIKEAAKKVSANASAGKASASKAGAKNATARKAGVKGNK
jgi:hypothetical protein